MWFLETQLKHLAPTVGLQANTTLPQVVYTCLYKCSGYACIHFLRYIFCFWCPHFVILSSLAAFLQSALICSHSCSGALMYDALMNSSEEKCTEAAQRGFWRDPYSPQTLLGSRCFLCAKRHYSAQQNTWAVKPLCLDWTVRVISWPERDELWGLQSQGKK